MMLPIPPRSGFVGLLDNLKRFVRDRVAPAAADQWPFIRGDYVVADATAPVVVTTAGDARLAEETHPRLNPATEK